MILDLFGSPASQPRARVIHGDCLVEMAKLEAESVDAVVTDPPYGIGFMGKEWDSFGSFVERKADKRNRFDHVGGNHNPSNPQDAARTRQVEGQKFGAWCELWAKECLRVLKPGGHLLAFGGSRTFHRVACAIEDAGFELRDTIMWVYGQGFPKGVDVAKQIDKQAGHWRGRAGAVTIESQPSKGTEYERGDKGAPITDEAKRWAGWNVALKPSYEPVCVARKPLAESTVASNVLRHGTGAINVDACRIESGGEHIREGVIRRKSAVTGDDRNDGHGSGSYASDAAFVATNHPGGRWPANLVHDGSDEVLACFPNARSSGGGGNSTGELGGRGQIFGSAKIGFDTSDTQYTDSGSAARFFKACEFSDDERRLFYSSKVSRAERNGSKHPTCKPLTLMRYLCRLVTPPGGVVLDPFSGSGTTLAAALAEGFRCVGIEREAEYVEDIRRRIGEHL